MKMWHWIQGPKKSYFLKFSNFYLSSCCCIRLTGAHTIRHSRSLGNVFFPVWLHLLPTSLFYYALADWPLFILKKPNSLLLQVLSPAVLCFWNTSLPVFYGSLLLTLQVQLKHYCCRHFSSPSFPCPQLRVSVPHFHFIHYCITLFYFQQNT